MLIAKSLVELMQEANQEVPAWLTQYAESNSGYGNNGGRSRCVGGGNKFGGRDFRSNNNYGNNNNQNYYGGHGEDYNYSAGYGGDSSSYYGTPSGANTGYEATSGAVSYAGDPEYAYDYGAVAASGWE